MKDYSSIEVIVPQPWRNIGRLYAFLLVITFIGYFWRIFIYPEPPDDEIAGIGYFSFFIAPISLLYLMPTFLNRYPSWFVRLVGRAYLTKLIAEFKRNVGKNRSNKAQLSEPKNWFEDKRVFWLVIIIGCGVLGLLQGAGLL
jgi:hypothetical protein